MLELFSVPLVWLLLSKLALNLSSLLAHLRLIACTSENETGAATCVLYYSGPNISWYEAHSTCQSQGFSLAAIPVDLGIAIYTHKWIAEHRMWEQTGAQFLKRLLQSNGSGGASGLWMIDAHREWYGTRGAALSNGTLPIELEARGYTADNVTGDSGTKCVTLNRYTRSFRFVDCNMKREAHFACVPADSSVEVHSRAAASEVCPSSWSNAKMNGTHIGKCFKQLKNTNNVWSTWDKARGACFDAGGTILSLSNHRDWFAEYVEEFETKLDS